MRHRLATGLPALVLALPLGLVSAPPAAAAAPTCGGLPVTITGTSGDDEITGTPGNDVIHASGGFDEVDGGEGDDVICGGGGGDLLRGGDGNDRLYGGRDGSKDDLDGPYWVGDTLAGGPGDDLLDPGADPRAAYEAYGETLSWASSQQGAVVDLAAGTATGDGTDTLVDVRAVVAVVTGAHDDTVTGSESADWIQTRGGTDTVRSGGGDDYVFGGPGDDDVRLGAGFDSVSIGRGSETVRGGPDSDTFFAHRGTHDLRGGAAGDWFYVVPTTGLEVRAGSGSKDRLVVERFADGGDYRWDMRSGGVRGSVEQVLDGFELVELWKGTWRIHGTRHDDEVYSWGPPVRFWGRGGDDRFDGARGDDLFDGGPGTDRFGYDERGRDVCVRVEKGTRHCDVVR